MQITFCNNAKTKYIQIYLTENELNNQETKDIIEEYKQKKYSVATFISGKENYPEILKRIIEKQVEITNNEY